MVVHLNSEKVFLLGAVAEGGGEASSNDRLCRLRSALSNRCFVKREVAPRDRDGRHSRTPRPSLRPRGVQLGMTTIQYYTKYQTDSVQPLWHQGCVKLKKKAHKVDLQYKSVVVDRLHVA